MSGGGIGTEIVLCLWRGNSPRVPNGAENGRVRSFLLVKIEMVGEFEKEKSKTRVYEGKITWRRTNVEVSHKVRLQLFPCGDAAVMVDII